MQLGIYIPQFPALRGYVKKDDIKVKPALGTQWRPYFQSNTKRNKI